MICLVTTAACSFVELTVDSLIQVNNQTMSELMPFAEIGSIALEVASDFIKTDAAFPLMLKYRHLIYLDETAHVVIFTDVLNCKDMNAVAAFAMLFVIKAEWPKILGQL